MKDEEIRKALEIINGHFEQVNSQLVRISDQLDAALQKYKQLSFENGSLNVRIKQQ